MKRDEKYVWQYGPNSADRVFVLITRVARDGSWADIQCRTRWNMWTKRQPLGRIRLVPSDWTEIDVGES